MGKSIQTMKESSVVSKNKIGTELYRKVVLHVMPDFVIDERNIRIMNELYYYVNNDDKGQYDHKKGILLWGSIGSGKSTIIRILGELLRFNGTGYKTVNCSYLANQYAAYGIDALNSSTYNETDTGAKPVDRAFDELGREPIPAKHYGNELNIMQYVFQCRYEIRHEVRTFATTNITPDSIGRLYGDYIADRITEMFNIVELGGRSRRSRP